MVKQLLSRDIKNYLKEDPKKVLLDVRDPRRMGFSR